MIKNFCDICDKEIAKHSDCLSEQEERKKLEKPIYIVDELSGTFNRLAICPRCSEIYNEEFLNPLKNFRKKQEKEYDKFFENLKLKFKGLKNETK